MRRRSLIVAALAIAGLAAGIPSSAQAGRRMEVALQDDSVFLNQNWYGRERAFARAKELGVTRLRVNFIWAHEVAHAGRRHAPDHVGYNWWHFDSLVDDARSHGIKVHLTLTGPAPAWATANHHVGVYKPSPRAYASFVHDVVSHFKDRVDRYSIWNEPNWKSWLAPHGSAPALYRRLYLAGYRAVKSVDPRAQVLIGETSPQARGSAGMAPLRFLRAMVGHSHLRADGYAHHPYDYAHSPHTRPAGSGDVTIANLGRLTGELSRLAHAHRLRTSRGGPPPLYLTEYGYFVHGRHALNQSRAAHYLQQAFSKALRNGRVRSMLQYGLVSPPFVVNWDTSLIAANGHPRRSFYSLRSWATHAARAGRIAR
jgi:hypothetical protein